MQATIFSSSLYKQNQKYNVFDLNRCIQWELQGGELSMERRILFQKLILFVGDIMILISATLY